MLTASSPRYWYFGGNFYGTIPFALPFRKAGFVRRRVYRHHRRDGMSPPPAGYALWSIGTTGSTITAAIMHACLPPDFFTFSSPCVARRPDHGSAIALLSIGCTTPNDPAPFGDIDGAVRPPPSQNGRLPSRGRRFGAVVLAAAAAAAATAAAATAAADYPASSGSTGCWFRSSRKRREKPEGAAASPEGGHPEAERPECPRPKARSEVARVREGPEVERVPWPGRAGGLLSMVSENIIVSGGYVGDCSSEGSGGRRNRWLPA